ncbi:ATG8-interacting protein 1 [Alnus glutinosa]|uniref:ATG8-interacting protein 1 n=1 Tax=Alnus glutinosa TaxID=3517 RepID=UPI002D764EDA|nr:ATG8-interacting protein 1 [Alnus glutinosa]XP_062154830.1 ATG8-interacting protein 1 [Alnus glutinosa]
MANIEEGEEHTSRGNEWEVVSLTASTYAAAPSPNEVEKDGDNGNTYREDGAVETSRALFMSGHFVFPPNEHENLPLETDDSEIHNKQGGKDVVSEFDAEEAGRSSGKDEENWTFKGLTVPDEFPGIQFFDEKGSTLSIHGKEFQEGTTLQGLNLVEKEQSIYSAAAYDSLHSETALGGSTTYGENMAVPGLNEQGLDFSPDISLSPTLAKDDKHDGSDLPCGAWWKRRAASLYAHAKEANTFWSIFIAAAVMGLVLLGQRWQQERWQALQLKWQISINHERTGRMLGPISRLKDVIVGGHRRGSVIRGSSLSES